MNSWNAMWGATESPTVPPDQKRLALVEERLRVEGFTLLDTRKWAYNLRKAELIREIDEMDEGTVDVALMMLAVGRTG